MKTPITYWGGKQQLLPKLLPLIPEHRQYDEPFFGGGALYFAKKPSEIEFINDINGEMVNFYRTLKLNFNALKQEVDCTLHSEFLHRKAQGIYNDPLHSDDVQRAWPCGCCRTSPSMQSSTIRGRSALSAIKPSRSSGPKSALRSNMPVASSAHRSSHATHSMLSERPTRQRPFTMSIRRTLTATAGTMKGILKQTLKAF